MALRFKFKTKDEVPAEHLSLYTERDGAWVMDVEGAVEKAKLDEFRNSNAALSKERDELKQRFDGIDAEVARTLLAEKQKAEEEKLLNGSPHPGPLPNAEREKAEKERERERIEKVLRPRQRHQGRTGKAGWLSHRGTRCAQRAAHGHSNRSSRRSKRTASRFVTAAMA